MKNLKMFCLLMFVGVFLLSGCVVRTYQTTRDRVDQDLSSGNRGYLKGRPSVESTTPRKTTRTTQVTEVELYPLVKFDKSAKKSGQKTSTVAENQDDQDLGNRGYISSSSSSEVTMPEESPVFEKYTVQKNDTLQKISQKFYGTTKKWNKIFEANQDTLKSPNKIYPGKVINIPLDGQSNAKSPALKEPKGNLK